MAPKKSTTAAKKKNALTISSLSTAPAVIDQVESTYEALSPLIRRSGTTKNNSSSSNPFNIASNNNDNAKIAGNRKKILSPSVSISPSPAMPPSFPGSSTSSFARRGGGSSSGQNTHSAIRNIFSNPFLVYAGLAGTCGALSAACIKIGVSSSSKFLIDGIIESTVGPTLGTEFVESFSLYVEYAIRGFIYIMNGYFTAQMWRFFLKSMSLGSVPVAQVVNTAVNFAVSALIGVVVFGEVVGELWFIGAFVAAIGLGLLVME